MARRINTWIVATALAVGGLACNALFGATSQCSTDADCTHFGAGNICGAGGTCVAFSERASPTTTPASTSVDAGALLATIAVSPSNASVPAGQTQQFSAIGKDALGNAPSLAPTFSWTVSGGGTIDSSGLFTAGSGAGGPYTVTVSSGSVSATASASVTASAPSPPSTVTVKIGETTVLNVDDSGNANLLLAQEATLGQTATIRSLSFYIATAAGQLRLGIYDASGPGGGPGTKKAETKEMAAAAGWNAAEVITPVSLPAGKYWLAYAPSDNNLHFNRADDGTGKLVFYSLPYGPMPTTFSTTPTANADHWSFYATLSMP